MKTFSKNKLIFIFFIGAFIEGCGGDGATTPNPTVNNTPAVTRILFVGDSFTHGRYTPVRSYNSNPSVAPSQSNFVVDENWQQVGARAELETGPWGGIPGIFAEFAFEKGLNYEVHIEAISATSLQKNYAAASGVIAQAKWNTVVLQEISTRPLPGALTGNASSNPSNFCASVKTIEQAVHLVASQASIYLYEPQPRADLAQTLTGSISASDFANNYLENLAAVELANRNAYYSAAADDGQIAGVAPAGEAWAAAWAAGIANPDPFIQNSSAPVLWYGLNASNDPPISSPDYLHPSIYGAYLNALVLFQKITGTSATSLGATEMAAAQLGIQPAIALQLQQTASKTLAQENLTLPSIDPCTLTN